MTFINKLSDGRFGLHSSYHGPFQKTDGSKYIPLVNTTRRTLGIAKASLNDPGDSDWSQAGPDVAVSGAADVVCLYSFYDEGNDRIGVATAQHNGHYRYHEFNTSTESWNISNEVIRLPAASPDEYQAAASLPSIAIAWRTDGDVTAVHNGLESDQSPAPGLYRAVRTSSWGALLKFNNSGSAPTGIVTAHNAPTVGSGVEDRTNYACQRGSVDVRRIHYNSSITIDNQNTGVNLGDAETVLGPGARDDSDVVYFPYVDSSDDVYVVSWDGQDNNSSTTMTITGPVSDQGAAAFNGASSNPFPPMGLVWDGSDVHLIYAANSDGDIYHNDDATSTGGTETKIVSGISCHYVSAGISADNNNILLIYGNGNTTPVFKRVPVGASAQPMNFPLCASLFGLRKLPHMPDLPPPTDIPVLPPVEGTTLWEQKWTGCVLSPHSLSGGATWDYDTRGAIGFSKSGEKLCNYPGQLRQNNWPSGTYETVFDSEITGNAVKITATRDQYNTKDQRPDTRNHTDFEYHNDKRNWSRSGRGWPAFKDYKMSFLIKLGDDFALNNRQWTIITQAFGFGDSNDGSRNPWMPLSVTDGHWKIILRGDSRSPLYGNKNYEYPNQAHAPTSHDLGPALVNTWELLEVWFGYDYRRTGGVGVGNGFCRVRRSGVEKLNISGIQLGYNDSNGSFMGMGIYHNFNSTSNADKLSLMFGGIRFEEI